MFALIIFAWLLVSPSDNGAAPDRELQAQQLLRATLAARDSLPLNDYIKQLEQVTRRDKKNANAFHELGVAYTRLETVWGRERALRAMERAIQLRPRDTTLHYSLAELHIKRGFDGAAVSAFKKIMQLDPSDGRPYYHLALFKEEDMLRFREMVSLHENTTIFFSDFAEEDYREAEEMYRTAIALDPKLFAASYRLAGLYYEARRFEEMADVLTAAIARHASPPARSPSTLLHHPSLFDLNLLLGLAQTRLHQTEKAQQAFERAFAAMPEEDRQLFFSLATVLSPDSLKRYLAADQSARRNVEQDFWQARDPLFLTTANERMLEHFSRIAYANLRFSFPEKNIAGWKTDRGQALIRFGFPKGRVRTRADLGSTPTGRITLNSSKEVWDYGDFHMLYEDRFLNQNYAFAWGSVSNSDGKDLFERQIRVTPERFEFPHGGKRLRMPHVIAQFRSAHSDSTLLEIFYGLPLRDLAPVTQSDAQKRFDLERGLFLCDQNWQPVLARREARKLIYNYTSADTVALLIERWPVLAPIGEYELSLEAIDRQSGRSGAERETLRIEKFSRDRLQMSSVILATQVEGASAELVLYRKDESCIIPNLSRQIAADSAFYVYYEVYNLVLDQAGQSRFRIENMIEPAPAKESNLTSAVKSLGRLFGFDERAVAVTSSFETSGATSEEKLHHAFTLPNAKPGAYRLTITVIDLNTLQRFARTLDFEIAAR